MELTALHFKHCISYTCWALSREEVRVIEFIVFKQCKFNHVRLFRDAFNAHCDALALARIQRNIDLSLRSAHVFSHEFEHTLFIIRLVMFLQGQAMIELTRKEKSID